jgi:prophage antirepressor-like protein
MESPQEVIINDIKYYYAKDIKEYDPTFFHGTAKSVRKIIEKHNINRVNYIYASYNKNKGWTIYEDHTKLSKSTKLLLTKEYIETNVPKMCVTDDLKYDIEPVPPLLELNDEEKFKDIDGNVMEIETRGERDCNNCYFKVKDISTAFDIPNIQKILNNKNNNYIEEVHYNTFLMPKITSRDESSIKIMFVTYEGLLRILFITRNNKTNNFIKWATSVLFTVQLGTEESKEELIEDIGISLKRTREVLNSSTSDTSCLYLLSLGYVKDLRDVFNINDNISNENIVCKYGKTKHFGQRLMEHKAHYKKVNSNISLSVLTFSMVDKRFLTEAENELRNSFNLSANNIVHDNHNELIFISKSRMTNVRQYFSLVQQRYVGTYTEKVLEMDTLKISYERALENAHHKTEMAYETIKQKNLIIENKDKDIENRDLIIENKDKDIEIERMKNMLLRNNISL